PVSADGRRLPLRARDALFIESQLAANTTTFSVNAPLDGPVDGRVGQAIAIDNALFTTSTAKSIIIAGHIAPSPAGLTDGTLSLTFDLQSLVPTLPDPYATNMEVPDPGAQPVGSLTAQVAWAVGSTTPALDFAVQLTASGQTPSQTSAALSATGAGAVVLLD